MSKFALIAEASALRNRPPLIEVVRRSARSGCRPIRRRPRCSSPSSSCRTSSRRPRNRMENDTSDAGVERLVVRCCCDRPVAELKTAFLACVQVVERDHLVLVQHRRHVRDRARCWPIDAGMVVSNARVVGCRDERAIGQLDVLDLPLVEHDADRQARRDLVLHARRELQVVLPLEVDRVAVGTRAENCRRWARCRFRGPARCRRCWSASRRRNTRCRPCSSRGQSSQLRCSLRSAASA